MSDEREQVHVVIGDNMNVQVFDTREGAEKALKVRKRLYPDRDWRIESWQVSQ